MRATITESGGCSCSLLADDADWNAPSWSIRPDVVGRLAATLEILARRGPAGLVVQAMWAGEAPTETVVVTPHELAEAVKAGRLGTHTQYTVRSETAG